MKPGLKMPCGNTNLMTQKKFAKWQQFSMTSSESWKNTP